MYGQILYIGYCWTRDKSKPYRAVISAVLANEGLFLLKKSNHNVRSSDKLLMCRKITTNSSLSLIWEAKRDIIVEINFERIGPSFGRPIY